MFALLAITVWISIGPQSYASFRPKVKITDVPKKDEFLERELYSSPTQNGGKSAQYIEFMFTYMKKASVDHYLLAFLAVSPSQVTGVL